MVVLLSFFFYVSRLYWISLGHQCGEILCLMGHTYVNYVLD